MRRQQAERGWPRSWLAALLAASMLSSCFRLAGAQVAIIPVTADPSKPSAGESITLTPEGTPDFAPCHWYRGATVDFTKRILTYYPPPNDQNQDGNEYTGRETGGPGCSLMIRNLTVNDAGTYWVQKIGLGKAASELGQVNIMVSDGPYVKLNPGGTLELNLDSHLKLECTVDSVPAAHVQWLFNDLALNVTGSIFSTQVEHLKDQGTYTCRATNPFTNRSASASAYVKVKRGSSMSSSLEAGSMAGIILGSLAILALNGTLLYFIFRARGQNDKTSDQIEAAPSSSDNFGPSRQVKTESSAENPIYQTLQHQDMATYGHLNIVKDKSTSLDTVPE